MQRTSFPSGAIAAALLVAISTLLITVPVALAIMTKATMPQLTAGSTGIVQGKVLSVTSEWGCDGATIFTYVTVGVDRWLKGTGPKTVTIRVPGGEVDGIGLWVEDTPAFSEGQDVVAFLNPSDEESVMQVHGSFQGKFTIRDGKVMEAGLPVGDFVRIVSSIVKTQERELNQK